jgi:nicotinamidase-related amidase
MTRAILVIDMQAALLEGAFRAPKVIENAAGLIDRARKEGTSVIYVQHNHATFEPMMKGNPGWEIHELLTPLASDQVVEKEASDAFYGTDLAETLRDGNVTEVVICGMMTEYCVDATARSALSNEFDVILASDAHTTGDSLLKAPEIIAHHNAVLPNVVHPTRRVRVMRSEEIAL